ncbi:MAG: VCBS repeat-containing protein [Bacteroidia bacterium]
MNCYSKLGFWTICLALFSFYACGERPVTDAEKVPDALFEKLDSSQTGIAFRNQVKETAEFNVLSYRNFYNGGGVAIGDLNGDGWSDVYFTANTGPNQLYLNRGNWAFDEVGQTAGVSGAKSWSTGVSFADVNSDGLLDIYVCNSGDIEGDNKTNELFINQGVAKAGEVPSFKEMSAEYGLNDPGFSTHASFFDYDRDGDLDCYLLNNSFKDPSRIDLYRKTREELDPLGGDKLFRNDGDKFTDVSQAAGIYSSQIGFGLGVSVSDLNGDLWPDIYISNDFWERDYLYINNQDGTFSEELTSRVPHTSVSSMGADLADINNDGHLEVFSTDMLAADNYRLKAMTMFDPYHLEDLKYRSNYHYQIMQNCLQLNNGKGEFQEIGFMANIASTDWSWGALMFDFDNDGWKDIYVANGIYHDIMYLDFTSFISDKLKVKEVVTAQGKFDFRDFLPFLPSNPLENYAFVNQHDLTFSDKAKELGLSERSFSNGSAYGDLDNDGDYDLIVNNVNMPAFVYRNQSEKQPNHYLKLKLEGSTANPLGIGAVVNIKQGDQVQVLQHYTARGFQSSMEPGLLFGLGSENEVDQLEIIWPDGKSQILSNIAGDQTLTLDYANAGEPTKRSANSSDPLLQATEVFAQAAVHQENTFNDFDHERLLPHMISTEGPRILKADVNGDLLEDVLVLGSKDQADQLWIQTQSGKLEKSAQVEFQADSSFESTCGIFFDPDGDGDQDLLLGAGGNEIGRGINAFLLRYYENDGAANFSQKTELTPPAGGQMSVIKAADIDGDGDQDLFIGGRSVPGNYGLPPTSFLFRNDNGKWQNITPPKMAGIGMLTDAAFADANSDGKLDLVLVGEWMPITIFLNQNDGFAEPSMVPHSEGWWTRIVAEDLDLDGKTDFVLGNWGLNLKFKASQEKPLEMYVKDFDQNKKTEFILNWYPPLDDQAYPFAGKMDMQAQLPHLKGRAVKYEDYAKFTYETLFNEEERKGAFPYRAKVMTSSVLWQGKNGFSLQALPLDAQIGPSFGIAVRDLNQDQKPDIILGGNFYGLKPEVGRFDSHRGVVLMAGENRTYNALNTSESGIWWEGQVRDLVWLKGAYQTNILLIGRNDEAVLSYELKEINP